MTKSHITEEYTIGEDACWHGCWENIRYGSVLDTETLCDVGSLRSVHQVHGALILNDDSYKNREQQADGLISNLAKTVLIIKTADCVPVLLSDGHRTGAVHAGWRGAMQGIVEQLARALGDKPCKALIGPAICQNHYEVGSDLYEPFRRAHPQSEPYFTSHKTDKWHFDLRGFVAGQLRAAGVEDITTIPLCTFDSVLPSYRQKPGSKERIYTYIYRTC